MGLPDTIRVKLSSEAAGAITMTPVVVQDIPTRELIELMLGVTGKDVARVQELLLRGTLVSGASRFRWTGWQADPAAIEVVLNTFPDPDPTRSLSCSKCIRAVLRGAATRIELTKEAAGRRRMFRRRSFWQAFIEAAEALPAEYVNYSYRDKADIYRIPLTVEAVERLRHDAGLLVYSTLTAQIRNASFDYLELFVER